ncbi:MAG: choice-of-anchor D domain-containing protein [Thermoleophilaceae bacterium]
MGMLVALLSAAALAVPAGSSAAANNEIVYEGGAVPQDLLDRFADCPSESDFPGTGVYLYCAHVKAYDGELKLGKVNASIDDPIEVTIGIALIDGKTVMIMPPGPGGPPKPVKISGGILGIPALDPVLDNSLGLLSVSATPQLGEIGAEAAANTPTHLNKITLPLSIKLDNTLFGKNCSIGTPEEPFTINLTTGTTAPPAGVAPISGTPPEESVTSQWTNYSGTGAPGTQSGTGAESVDNTFAVPGAKNCDLLPSDMRALGPKLGLGSLFGPDRGVFDPVINQQVGLPSAAGNNRMSIKVDTEWVTGTTVGVIKGENTLQWTTSEGSFEFGDVPVGSSVDKTITVTNILDSERTFGSSFFSLFTLPEDTSIVSDTCENSTIPAGGTCQITLRFAPTSPGQKFGLYSVDAPPDSSMSINARGRGI